MKQLILLLSILVFTACGEAPKGVMVANNDPLNPETGNCVQKSAYKVCTNRDPALSKGVPPECQGNFMGDAASGLLETFQGETVTVGIDLWGCGHNPDSFYARHLPTDSSDHFREEYEVNTP